MKRVLFLIPEEGCHSNQNQRIAFLEGLCKELGVAFTSLGFTTLPQDGGLWTLPEGISNHSVAVFQGLIPSREAAYYVAQVLPVKVALITGANLLFAEDRQAHNLPEDFLERVTVFYAPDDLSEACRRNIRLRLAELLGMAAAASVTTL